MTDDLVKQLRDAFDAGSDNGWDQARADPLYGPHPMTNEEAFCAFLAALEPVAAPDHAAIREAALREAAKRVTELMTREVKSAVGDGYNLGLGTAYEAILALIQKGDTDDRA